MADDVLIAVVDDEPGVRQLLADVLTRSGYRVAPCAGAQELWSLLAAERPALLLLDICMPGEDGLSVARRVRAESDAGIIMVTALGDPVDKVVGLEIGADDYVSKPFDPHELLARVRSVLRRRKGAPSLAPDLLSHMERLASKLDQVTSEVGRLTDETRHMTEEAEHIEEMLHEHRVEHCPQCSGSMKYHRAEQGSMGICNSCGWSHFVEE